MFSSLYTSLNLHVIRTFTASEYCSNLSSKKMVVHSKKNLFLAVSDIENDFIYNLLCVKYFYLTKEEALRFMGDFSPNFPMSIKRAFFDIHVSLTLSLLR
jgi:hypothetical protein